jgi:hypothetical protein
METGEWRPTAHCAAALQSPFHSRPYDLAAAGTADAILASECALVRPGCARVVSPRANLFLGRKTA